MKLRLLQLLIVLSAILVMTSTFYLGRLTGDYQSGYEQALDDVASGEVVVTSRATRAQLERELDHARQVEYERVVLQVAEKYQKDPSEIEVECGLTDAHGNILRGERITEDDPRWDCHTVGNRICGPLN